MKNKGGRPKRFENGAVTISFQLSKEMAEQYEKAAQSQGLSKSRFAQYLFEQWIYSLFKK